MSGVDGEPTRRPDDVGDRKLRLSDADRERSAARLQAAVGEGRLAFDEFEQRMTALYAARTAGDLEPLVSDLPTTTPGPAARDTVELRAKAGSVKRSGRWVAPRRLVVRAYAGSVKLNFSEAVITHPEMEIDLDVQAGSVVIVVPDGATAEADDVSVEAGSIKHKASQVPVAGAPHFRITGRATAGSMTIRYRRRFWRWSW